MPWPATWPAAASPKRKASTPATAAGLEVDFAERGPGGDQALIQVCATLDDPTTEAREVRALQDAAPAWPQATLHLIALDRASALQVPAGIQLHPPRTGCWQAHDPTARQGLAPLRQIPAGQECSKRPKLPNEPISILNRRGWPPGPT